MTDVIEKTLKDIEFVSTQAVRRAQGTPRRLTKPVNSLGRLEELACRYAAIHGSSLPLIHNKNRVCIRGRSRRRPGRRQRVSSRSDPQMVLNFLNEGAAINVLAKHARAEVVVVIVGVDHDFGPLQNLLDKKIAGVQRILAEGPAMTRNRQSVPWLSASVLRGNKRSKARMCWLWERWGSQQHRGCSSIIGVRWAAPPGSDGQGNRNRRGHTQEKNRGGRASHRSKPAGR